MRRRQEREAQRRQHWAEWQKAGFAPRELPYERVQWDDWHAAAARAYFAKQAEAS